METGTSRVRVEILGQTYALRGPTSVEHLLAVARKVDDMMKQVSSANPTMEPNRIAVLAAVNLADELSKMRKQYENLLTLLEEKTASPKV